MNIDDLSQSLANPRKNKGYTEPSAIHNVSDQVQLESYSLQFPTNITTNTTSHRIPTPVKDYFCFHNYGRTAQ